MIPNVNLDKNFFKKRAIYKTSVHNESAYNLTGTLPSKEVTALEVSGGDRLDVAVLSPLLTDIVIFKDRTLVSSRNESSSLLFNLTKTKIRKKLPVEEDNNEFLKYAQFYAVPSSSNISIRSEILDLTEQFFYNTIIYKDVIADIKPNKNYNNYYTNIRKRNLSSLI